MVDEKDDKYDHLEEGEYHFSDDQNNYDVEPELPKSSSQAAAISGKENVLEKLSRNRRALIVTALLLALVFVIYKMLIPVSAPPPTEFTQETTAAVAPPPKVEPVVSQPAVSVPAPTPSVAQAPQAMPPAPAAPPAQPSTVAPLPVQQPAQAAPFAPPSPAVSPPTVTTQIPSAAATMPPVAASTVPAMGAVPPPILEQQTKGVPERLAALEEQNAKLVSLLQTQYAQKIVDYEAQNNATQERMRALNKRLANMEASLNQMAQLLQGRGGPLPAAAPLPPPLVKSMEPKLTFTVQAIIPGRAWLKSDSGDTVTVAEGDILKDYGRVTKIDPYDGIVDIDTGSKVITLTYGMNGDQ